jgi:accessory colonization factor AcfC
MINVYTSLIMRNIVQKILLLCVVVIFFAQCKKADDTVEVYGPPAQSITFSEVSDLIIDSTGKTIAVKAKIASTDGLEKVEIIYGPWSVAKTITAFSNANSASINEPVLIPANAALKLHSIVVKATDKKGATNFTEVKVGLQDLNYNKLYMADVEDPVAIASDLFGVPQVMDKVGAHTYRITYYVRNANTKVRFLPNKSSFTPVAIGTDPANSAKLITDAASSLPIVLASKGYYTITVNTLLLSYTVESVSATGTAPAQVALAGRGFFDFPSMNWQNVLPNIRLLDKDPDNPFLFTKEIKLGIPAGQSYTTAQFIMTTNNGWTNFWRFDNASSPELAVANGGVSSDFPITATPVTYLYIFDAFTRRVQAIKK